VLTRRRFVAVVAALISGSRAAASASNAFEPSWACSVPDRELLVDLVGDWQAARALGACYLREHPHEADVRRFSDLASGPEASREAFRRRIATARRRDLEEGRVLVVNGWQLARTEARLCALAALTA
jgi:hypothetical protein